MDLKKISKRMSYVLRHKPEDANLLMDAQGWVGVTSLLYDLKVDLTTLETIVNDNNKKRFELSPCRSKIRAVQGHSVQIDLELEVQEPPHLLYHGTALDSMKYIVRQGILPMGRNHVHLSVDKDVAKQVGGRHGKPYVMAIFAYELYQQGQAFYKSKNGVWLTSKVPPQFIFWPTSDKREFQGFYHGIRPIPE